MLRERAGQLGPAETLRALGWTVEELRLETGLVLLRVGDAS